LRALDAQTAMLHLSNMEDQVRGLVAEGLDALAAEQNRTAMPLARTYWYDQNLNTFLWKFARAKRTTYLAVQAVEYESQNPPTLAAKHLRSRVLAARSPGELDMILSDLSETWNTRAGSDRVRWTMQPYVFRVRDTSDGTAPQTSLYAIDAQGATSPTHGDSNLARFRELLTSRQNAVYDSEGHYEGQGIKFSITPANTDINSLTLYDKCAERLWRVRAAINPGTQANYQGLNVALELRKDNTFYSQKCDPNEDASHYQVAGIISNANPFAGDIGPAGSSALRYSSATLSASVDPNNLGNLGSVDQGVGSEVFADWGLYGDYVLLFKYKGPLQNGFDLSQVYQIYLAFDTYTLPNGHPPATVPPLPLTNP
jgi:hypothetical protein